MSQPPEASEPSPADDDFIQIKRSHLLAAAVPLAFLIGLAAGYLAWGRSPSTTSAPLSAPPATQPSSRVSGRIEVEVGDDPSLGPPDAPIVIVEFSDFNCPFCRQFHQETFTPLMQAFPDQIHFVYKDFPIVGGGTVGAAAAQAANCAGEQESYWEYHDALFSGRYALDRSGFERYAVELGLDEAELLACIDSGRYAEEVDEDLRYGASLGVSGTPTFFVNGIPVVGAQPLLRFIEIINRELNDS